jgi:Ser/Thr protein kinase RdoA (MazF antagonist)
VRRLADAGLPVPAPIGAPRMADGALHILMPFLGGRPLGAGLVSDARYRQLGRELARFHAAIADLPPPAQRPGYCETVDGALPLAGGRARRAELLAALARADAALAGRFARAAEALDARDLPAVFAGAPRLGVHADFSPWNVRFTGGRLTGILDFELAHRDVRAADVAASRRGWHDAVVDGYREVTPLTDAELAALDALWLGGVLAGVWRVLEDRLVEGSELTYGLDWHAAQLDKTRPYRPAAWGAMGSG